MRGREDHHKLTNGIGKCSVPMWDGLGECFCDGPAYGKPLPYEEFRNGWTGRMQRFDGGYNGYVPGLACPAHGGPKPRHFGDPCVHCGIPHDDVPIGPCQPR
jgi:hypothetical protein